MNSSELGGIPIGKLKREQRRSESKNWLKREWKHVSLYRRTLKGLLNIKIKQETFIYII